MNLRCWKSNRSYFVIFTSLVCQMYITEFFLSLNLSLKIELENGEDLSSRP